MSFEVILPFLRPIAHLIQDPEVSKIMVNGSQRVFVEREGLVREVGDVNLDERNLRVAVKNIARALGDDVSEEQPILDARLPDGSRVAAVLSREAGGSPAPAVRLIDDHDLRAHGGARPPCTVDENAAHFVIPARQILDLKRRRARCAGALEGQTAASVVRAGFGDDFELPVVGVGFHLNSNGESRRGK